MTSPVNTQPKNKRPEWIPVLSTIYRIKSAKILRTPPHLHLVNAVTFSGIIMDLSYCGYFEGLLHFSVFYKVPKLSVYSSIIYMLD